MLQNNQSEEFINALNEARYYDGHEILEASWFPVRFDKKNPEVILMRGLINAAVSFELLKRGRPNPSLKPWNNYQNSLVQINNIASKKINAYQKLITHIELINKTIR